MKYLDRTFSLYFNAFSTHYKLQFTWQKFLKQENDKDLVKGKTLVTLFNNRSLYQWKYTRKQITSSLSLSHFSFILSQFNCQIILEDINRNSFNTSKRILLKFNRKEGRENQPCPYTRINGYFWLLCCSLVLCPLNVSIFFSFSLGKPSLFDLSFKRDEQEGQPWKH